MADVLPCFIISPPRSGSTLLQRMLGAHPEVATHPEPHLLSQLAYSGYYAQVDAAPYDHINAARALTAFVSHLPAGEADYYAGVRALCDTLFSGYARARKCGVFLDKTPANALILPFIEKVYPQGRYVVLTRHPLAIFSSYAQSFFDGDWAAAYRFNPVLERYLGAIGLWQSRTSVQVHTVAYEALAESPETHARALAAFLGLPFVPEMVNYGDVPMTQGAGDPHQVSRHRSAFTSSIDRWKADVASSPERLRLAAEMLARVGSETLSIWGYPYADILAELETLATARPELGPAPKPPKNAYALQRKVLLALRRDVHEKWHGKALKQVRYYCDVILRDSL